MSEIVDALKVAGIGVTLLTLAMLYLFVISVYVAWLDGRDIIVNSRWTIKGRGR